MIDARSLFEQFLGRGGDQAAPQASPFPGKPGAVAPPGSAWPDAAPQKKGAPSAWDKAAMMKQAGQPFPPQPSPWPAQQPQQQPASMMDRAREMLGGAGGALGGLGGVAGGVAAGGLLGTLFGRRSTGRSVLTHGGAAMLGALAFRAWQNWQARTPPASAPPAAPQDAHAMEPRFLPGATPAAGGEPFELALVRAMIAAAQADGHIDTAERNRIFEQVERSSLDAASKGLVFSLLNTPLSVEQVAAGASTPEQAAEIWLASRLTMDMAQPAERAYLEALAARLNIEPELVAHLERQVEATTAG